MTARKKSSSRIDPGKGKDTQTAEEKEQTKTRTRAELDTPQPTPSATVTHVETSAAATTGANDRSLYPWASAPTDGGASEDTWGGIGANGAGSREDARAEGVPSVAEALALADGEYLSGCRIILVGFAAADLKSLVLLVRKGCGIR